MTDKIETIYDFYDSLLTLAGYSTRADGTIWLESSKPDQIVLGGKKLVLPLKSRLKEPRDDEMFFHPLCEQMQRYESEVFKWLKKSLTIRLMSATIHIGTGLLKLQEDPALQRRLSIEQIEVIKGIKSFDKHSINAWRKMVMHALGTEDKNRMDRWPIHIYLKRNGTFEGKNYRRVASVSFPFATDLIQGGQLFNDSEKNYFRPKDYPMFSEVFMSIWPETCNPGETYNSGWNDAVAPYLSSFLLAFKKMADRINYLFDLFAEVFAEIGLNESSTRIPTDWHELLVGEGLETYTKFSGAIPQLKGNTGETTEDEDKAPEQEAVKPIPVRQDRKPDPAPVKAPEVTEAPKAAGSVPTVPGAEQKMQEEMRAKRAAWKAEQEREAKEDEERRQRRAEREKDDAEYDRQRREREDRRREKDDPPWDETPKKTAEGKLSAADLFRNDDRRDSRDRDYRDRDRRDDRDYRDRDRRDDRDRGWGRDRDRDYRDDRDRDFFDRRDDRDYRDRGYGRDRDRDDRDRNLRDSPWGRSRGGYRR